MNENDPSLFDCEVAEVDVRPEWPKGLMFEICPPELGRPKSFLLKLGDVLATLERPPDLEVLGPFASCYLVSVEYPILRRIVCDQCGHEGIESESHVPLAPHQNLDWPYACPGGDMHDCRCGHCGYSNKVTFWLTR